MGGNCILSSLICAFGGCNRNAENHNIIANYSFLNKREMVGRRNEAKVLTCLVRETNPGRAVGRNDAQSPDDFRGVPSSDFRKLES